MADCEQYELLISAEIDEGLSEEEMQTLQAHLTECPSCSELREAMRLAVSCLNDGLTEAPPELLKGISYKISLGKKRFGLHVREWRFTALAAVLCLTVFGVLKLMPRDVKESAAPMMQAAKSYSVAAEPSENVDDIFCMTGEADCVSGDDDDSVKAVEDLSVAAEEDLPVGKVKKSFLCVSPAAPAATEMPMEESGLEPETNDAANYLYAADTQRGYETYNKVQNKENYYGIYILYDTVPECISQNGDCKRMESGAEEEKWLTPLSMCHRLEDECLADEIYYGDLMQSQGLVIILKNGADEDGND